MNEAIFPGCSLTGYSRDYYVSTKLILNKLSKNLSEIPQWNCCGATILPSTSIKDFERMVERNIERALECDIDKVVVPCSSCYVNLFKFSKGRIRITHLLHYLHELKGKIKENIEKKIELRLIPYYGCQTIRPFIREDSNNPTSMDEILRIMGAEVVNFPFKAKCCGGVFTHIDQKIGEKIVYDIFSEFLMYADLIITVCPLCRLNLETIFYKENVKKPVLYLTQILGLSMGFGFKELMIEKSLIDVKEIKQCI